MDTTRTTPTTPTTRTVLRAEGFTCPSCLRAVEKQVRRVDGVHDVVVRFSSQRVEVDHTPGVAADELVAAVAGAGFRARPAAG